MNTSENPILRVRSISREDAVFRPERCVPAIPEVLRTVREHNLRVRESDLLMLVNGDDIFMVSDGQGGFEFPAVGRISECFPNHTGEAVDYLEIGRMGDQAVFVCSVDKTEAGTPDGVNCGCMVSLRTLMGCMDPERLAWAVAGSQLCEWYRTSAFCGVCGRETKLSGRARATVCTACGHHFFPRLSPAVITAILRDDRILLAHNRRFPGEMCSLIAGFVDPGETLEEAVAREAMEEVGIGVEQIRYLGSQCWPFPNSLMLGFVAEWKYGELTPDGVEIDRAEWFDFDRLPELPMNISISRKIIDYLIGLKEQ